MKTYAVLYSIKNNENSTTPPDPIGEWLDGKCVRRGKATEIDLKATSMHCVSYDNDMLVECNTYSLRQVTLPDWLSLDEWLDNTVRWKWAWAFGAKPDAWPERWQRVFAYDLKGSAEKLVCAKLLNTKKFRSEFRKSLRDQLIQWIESDDRAHTSPFSGRQFDMLIQRRDLFEAKRLDENCYRNRNYTGAGQYLARQ